MKKKNEVKEWQFPLGACVATLIITGEVVPEDMIALQEMARLLEKEIRRGTDAKFIAAGHKPEDPTCNHAEYRQLPEPRPRHCPKCGTCMWDAGD